MRCVVLVVRNFTQDSGKAAGLSYTLGSDPHETQRQLLNYSRSRVWQALTRGECVKRGVDPAIVDAAWDSAKLSRRLGFDPWGGRDVVGGSGWNTPSMLLPHEVIDVVAQVLVPRLF